MKSIFKNQASKIIPAIRFVESVNWVEFQKDVLFCLPSKALHEEQRNKVMYCSEPRTRMKRELSCLFSARMPITILIHSNCSIVEIL